MSVILRDKQGKIMLYCKGAVTIISQTELISFVKDNVIFERLSMEHNSPKLLQTSQQALDDYAHKGYRTLCFAATEIPKQIYDTWSREFNDASTAIENRDEKLALVAEKVERNLNLVGLTAIEDKLQEVGSR